MTHENIPRVEKVALWTLAGLISPVSISYSSFTILPLLIFVGSIWVILWIMLRSASTLPLMVVVQ